MSKRICQICGGQMQATFFMPISLDADQESGALHPVLCDEDGNWLLEPEVIETHVRCENNHEWEETGWTTEWRTLPSGRKACKLVPLEQHSGLVTSPGYAHAAGYPD